MSDPTPEPPAEGARIASHCQRVFGLWIQYGVHFDGAPDEDVITFPGHTLERYRLIAEKNGGTVVMRWIGPWEVYSDD